MAEPIKTTGIPAAQPKPATQSVAKQEIAELAQIKANMVSKEELDKANAEKERYRQALLNGVANPDDTKQRSRAELVQDYAESIKKGVTNLQGFKTALELRQATINETGKDPFMSEALHKIDPAFGDRVATQLGELIESSGNSPEVFTAKLGVALRS